MTITFQSLLRRCLLLTAIVLPLPAYSQVALTGASWYATYSNGGTNISQAYALGFVNTLPGDQWWDLWIALNPDATSPVNGPSDAQAGISVPLQAGQRYKYYFFSDCCDPSGDSGLSLFFDGSVTPGISVFGPLSRLGFAPDSASILSLQGNPILGTGSSFYASGGLIALLTEFNANAPATPPGNVCQQMSFTPNPDGGPCGFGSFTLDVHTAATLVSSRGSSSPFAELPLAGSGFAPGEQVNIVADILNGIELGKTTAGENGAFATTVRLPQLAYGVAELFAWGQTSSNIGAAGISVTSSVTSVPDFVTPGETTAVQGLGFGSKELVDVYLDEPRQLLGTATADSAGSFIGANALTVTVPINSGTGLNGLLGIGQTTNAIGIGKIIVK